MLLDRFEGGGVIGRSGVYALLFNSMTKNDLMNEESLVEK